tara:strand:- start:346 stop:660 length:315 start_codon:yes stop_codon:yes gene_type:complete
MVKTNTLLSIAVVLIVMSMFGVFLMKVSDTMPYIQAAEKIDFTKLNGHDESVFVGDEISSARQVKEELLTVIPEVQEFLNMFLIVIVVLIIAVVVVNFNVKRKS